MSEILRVARKEFRGFFASPAAYLFLGAFLAVTLFVFFWIDTFFARNIADVRPLFHWLPVLLIFLVAALTMRAWSEERRAGTLESLLTAPIKPLSLVLGKFTAALGLVALALLLTLPLPITVSLLGPLDWGPVVGGYVASLFLAAAYVAIGLYMSGRTDNPIVALILTAVVCGLFYLIGSSTLTNLFGLRIADILDQLGTGTRFESITRGVLDLRDLYYYVSIVGVFLSLNLLSLERLRWAGNPSAPRHRAAGWTLALVAANFAAANFWLAPVAWARVDITHGHIYSLSPATHHELAQLQEPLLIRGYFSSKTHPLLAPLVPQLKDLLEEYAVAGGEQVHVEFVDPQQSRAAAEEAANKYGIKPVPFQTANRYQASVVNSYFNIVVAYGDQFQTLDFKNLIEVKGHDAGSLQVALKNPEYEITRAIRKVVSAYRAGGNPFATLNQPVSFHGYLSPDDKLPEGLRKLHAELGTLLADLQKQSAGKLTLDFQDPDADGGALAQTLKKDYGFSPEIASLSNPQPFWFYMVLQQGKQTVQVPMPESLDKDALKRSLDAAIRRLAPGFLKTVALYKPAQPYGKSGEGWTRLQQALSDNVRVEDTDLKDGRVPGDADLLMVLSPENLDDKQRFAIDQFLMQGGSVVVATSPFKVSVGRSLDATKVDSGLKDWLAHMGVDIKDTLVLDPRNASLPVPVQRYIGSLPIREIRMMPYPHFLDVRGDDLNPDDPITANLQQLTIDWVSPIKPDVGKDKARKLDVLARSSPDSWTSNSLDVLPNYEQFPSSGFAVGGQRGSQDLAVALQGRFDSFFQGKPSPLAPAADTSANGNKNGKGAKSGPAGPAKPAQDDTAPTSVIEHSPDSARLVVVASNSFASDASITLASQGLGTLYTKPLAFMQNVVDWSLEDPALLALRGRTEFARTLRPLSESEQRTWEYLNYALALAGLAIVWGWRRLAAGSDRRRYQRILAEV